MLVSLAVRGLEWIISGYISYQQSLILFGTFASPLALRSALFRLPFLLFFFFAFTFTCPFVLPFPYPVSCSFTLLYQFDVLFLLTFPTYFLVLACFLCPLPLLYLPLFFLSAFVLLPFFVALLLHFTSFIQGFVSLWFPCYLHITFGPELHLYL